MPSVEMEVPGVPSSAVFVHDGSYICSKSRYSCGTLLAPFGKILLAIAEISLRIVTVRVSDSSSGVAPSRAVPQTSYCSHRSSSGLIPPVTVLPSSSRFG